MREYKTGYARRNDLDGKYRPMTMIEAKNLRYGDTVHFEDTSGKVRECRVTGKVKTWKTRPDIRVPVKYGLYESSYIIGYGDRDTDHISRLDGVRALVPCKAKRVYGWKVWTNYGYGWECEVMEDTISEARNRAREYRENTLCQVKVKRGYEVIYV